MEREVAAGYYDFMMVDTDFEFRNFTQNIPKASTSFIDSDRSSFIDTTLKSSINMLVESNRLAQSKHVIPDDSLCP